MFKSILNLLLAILFCFTSQAALGQVADFTASDTAGCLPKIISFTNTSSGSPTGYSWNLGNGSPLQTSRDVTASYTAAGVYTVTLITFYGTGSSTKTLQIHIYDAPTVSFNVSDTAVCPGAPITFTSTSVPNSWGTMTNSWNFGDGGSSSSYTASYSYPLPGYYNVTLFATNAPGCTGSLTKNKLIHVFDNSVLNFSATPTGFCKTPQNVTFLNTTTGINPLTYTWRFGDGGISSATNPTHTYTTSGNYNVTLLVKNGKGCLDSVVASSYINAGSLSASFTNTVNVCTKSVISFNNTSSTHVSCQWYFGDGGSATDESPVYAYGAPGIYTVKLVVFDGTCYDSVTHNVNVLPLPSGSFSSSPIHPCFDPTHAPPGPSVTYLASVPGGSIINWTFPDGSTGSGSPYTKIFAPSFGTIGSVSMTITSGSTGCQNTFSRTDSVLDLNLNPISDVTNGCAPLTCNFDVQAYSIAFDYFTSSIDVIMPYPYSLTSYDWDFRDGSPHSFAPKPMHVFSSPGVYNVKVTVRTVDGCIDSNTIAIAIGKKPNPTFTITPTHICAGKSVSLTCTSLDTIDMYTWDYGDGKVDVSPALPKTTHTYTVPGVFDVNMMVERYGCKSAFAVHKDTVDSPSAVIFYKYDCIPSNGISFTDTSLGDDTHLWQFGDGSTSTLHFIDHPYPSLALYTVTLTTFNNKSGCRDTSRTSIDLRRPNMAFTVTSTQLCRDRLDSFNALVSGPGSPPTLFKWYVDGAGKDSTGAGFFPAYVLYHRLA